MLEMVAVNWISYRYRGAWQAMPPEELWDAVAQRFPADSFAAGSNPIADPEERQGEQLLIQLYHLALYSGSEALVRFGTLLDPPAPTQSDLKGWQTLTRYMNDRTNLLRTLVDEFVVKFEFFRDLTRVSPAQSGRWTVRS